MKLYNLSSMISAGKEPVPLKQSSHSFGVAPSRSEPYIEPTFEQVEFGQQKPAVVLVSAVGATGKTTLARVLSSKTGLPLLDLAKHKPVGDNTVTGLLTNAFSVDDLTRVFQRIGRGTFGLIIDGVDEGRSKTTEKAFEAFLDDVARLCKGAAGTSFVLLGRTQILEDCWVYLVDQGIPAGLVTIKPFDLGQARRYIDEFTRGPASPHAEEYGLVRDMILARLGAAFTHAAPQGDEGFLSFIGYPPVLDAIATLLQQEKNYHRLRSDLETDDGQGVEVGLLQRIALYILQREKKEKVLPNILSDLVHEMPESERQAATAAAYGAEEQCARLTSYCLGRRLELKPLGKPALDNEYENRLRPFLPEHPFITGAPRQFRNAIFEAVALSTLILSPKADAVHLALEYVDAHKHNYHLLYLLHRMAEGRHIPPSALRVIIGSALEFRSRKASVQINVGDPDTLDCDNDSDRKVSIDVEIIMGDEQGQSKSFPFESDVSGTASVNLGDRLSWTNVFLPCRVLMSGQQGIDITAPTVVFAPEIELSSSELTLRVHTSADQGEKLVLLAAEALESAVGHITTNGADLVFAVADRSGITYPAIQYVHDIPEFPSDDALKEKYLRLRRILVHFRSHSRGALAKYRAKIENERVVRNPMGWAILRRLVQDEILRREGDFYFLQPANVDKYLGVSWIDLRKGATSDKLEQYLMSIDCTPRGE